MAGQALAEGARSSPLTPELVAATVRELPPLPAVVTELIESLGHDELRSDDLARKISLDQALSAKTLRLANSSFYGMTRSIGSIQEAITILGLRTVRTVVMAAGVTGSFRRPPDIGFDFDAFWRHSIGTALACQALAREVGLEPDIGFTVGLMHDIGRVALANAPGAGVADDKAVYTYMPEIIRFFTGEEAILKNVPTWRCSEPEALKYVLDNLADLVVKEVHGSGGYGMLIGPTSSRKEIAAFEAKLRARPDNYIAQPTLSLSTVPILTKAGLAPRHVDLRPFVLVSPGGIDITPGGLTRVALKKGSLVVNSSQGGGTKDSWVLDD